MKCNFKRVKPETLEAVMRALGGASQQIAVLKYIHEHPDSFTHQIAGGAAAINVPDVAQRLRPICARYGIILINYLPSDKFVTRHGTKSQLHKWRIESNDNA